MYIFLSIGSVMVWMVCVFIILTIFFQSYFIPFAFAYILLYLLNDMPVSLGKYEFPLFRLFNDRLV